jgi:hypothetical protein
MKDTGHFVDFLVLGDLLVAEMGLGHGEAQCSQPALYKWGFDPQAPYRTGPRLPGQISSDARCIAHALRTMNSRTSLDLQPPKS